MCVRVCIYNIFYIWVLIYYVLYIIKINYIYGFQSTLLSIEVKIHKTIKDKIPDKGKIF